MTLRAPVVAFTGAGLSTASGIPDFRSPGGVWDRFDPREFTIDRFRFDPAGFWDRRARLIAAMDYLDAEPNAAHHALAEAVRDGRVACVVTQNVDGLHAKAGTPQEALVELHGNGGRCVCTRCFRREATEAVLARRVDGEAPTCLGHGGRSDHGATGGCGGLVKPDVVLFGEPVTAMPEALGRLRGAGTLLVAGTSLQVHPAAGLVDAALAAGADVVLVNRDATPYDAEATRVVRGAVEEELPRLLRSASYKSSLQ